MENENYTNAPVIDGQPEDGKATAALVLGIVGILCCGPCAVVGLIMALQAKNAGNTSGKCTAGMVLSIIGIVLWIGALIFNIATGAFSTIMDSYS
ncbi:hypothetical protein SAMN05216413_1698 [Ruminococcaceae bacterium KH2T8]|nr:hypothetical protein SAMN05216413_1698 [Ruminococcaceae bacterium KH2T8]